MHKCNAVTAWFRDHREFTVIEWPSRLPDLNPIENLWGILVNEWTDSNERTPDVHERHYMEVWESILRDPELCQQLVQSMRHRMQDCIDNGSRTKPPLRLKPPPAKKKKKSSQNPSPTKIPLQPKTTADKNSPPGERVRLHVIIKK